MVYVIDKHAEILNIRMRQTIVTGNGFTGNAQRIATVAGSSAVLRSDAYTVTNGAMYKATFKIRLDVITLTQIRILDSNRKGKWTG